MRQTGILMPLSALPSRSGVGEMGEQAYRWIDILKENKVGIWQILPLNPVGYGNSPYQPYSSYAGDEIYISLEFLFRDGLLEEEVPAYRENALHIDYALVRAYKKPFLKKAFHKFEESRRDRDEAYKTFAEKDWVYDYCVFAALKDKNHGRCWNEWTQREKEWPEKREDLPGEIREEAQYHLFLQYVFDRQWSDLKKEANRQGIRIMGDIPFYVGTNSADVWAGKKNFLLDREGVPTFIAGVPPDYFSKTGQRWGNPIYDWDYMKEDDYAFWIARMRHCGEMFDITRIDHFRAFDTYWKIPASCPTAIVGEWVEAPGYEVIGLMQEKLPKLNLVAEDLGELRDEVHVLKDHFGLKGMKILLFSLNLDGKYAVDTFPDKGNLIIYSGTHDNDTLEEWYQELSPARQRKVRRFLKKNGHRNGSVRNRLIEYLLRSEAEYAILPAADVIGLGKEGHINTPGTVGSPNWEWRICIMDRLEKEMRKIRAGIVQRGNPEKSVRG